MVVVSVAPTVSADRLKPALKAQGLSQAGLARRLGVSHIDICRCLSYAASGGLLERIAGAVFDSTADCRTTPND